jgi:putative transposase
VSHSITVRKTYKYRLYRCDKRDQYLHQQITVAGQVWNHALTLQKRYYRLTGNYIPLARLQAHIAKLRMSTKCYARWQPLGSQAVQDICKRLDNAFMRFFKRLAKRPPKFKNVKCYPSFTLKQVGWKLVSHNQNVLQSNGKYRRARGLVDINGTAYKFVQHYPMGSCIVKTVTVKRDALGRFWVCFSVIEEVPVPEKLATGQTAGFDFGLKTFLTDHMGKAYLSPLFYKQELKRIRTLQKRRDKKPHGTSNRRKATRLLSRAHIRIADKRRDYHFRLAKDLCDEFDVLVFEDLNLDSMKRLWGRKVSDLGFAQFVTVLEYIARKRGKQVVFIGHFERTTGKCSRCEHEQVMSLRERTFCCDLCSLVIDRDHNAAINILRAGASAHTGREVVSRWATNATLPEARRPQH